MKQIAAAAMGLTFAAITASGQTTNYSQEQHIHTALNHLTVVELGEPVTTIAVANPDAFSVEHHGDKVFLKPAREKESTNLFIWTATRQLSYELDPAGDVASLNVVICELPPSGAQATVGQTASLGAAHDDAEIQKIASVVLTQAMLGSQDIAHDEPKVARGRVNVELNQVFRGKEATYIRYSIANTTDHPYRVTTPDVAAMLPTQMPAPLASLRNHQLRQSFADDFKAKRGQPLTVVSADISAKDLAPGQSVTGVVGVRNAQTNPPQLFELHFGTDSTLPVTAEAVL
jgi:hypothetical protein